MKFIEIENTKINLDKVTLIERHSDGLRFWFVSGQKHIWKPLDHVENSNELKAIVEKTILLIDAVLDEQDYIEVYIKNNE